jgi:AraC-like DNA-binding protein
VPNTLEISGGVRVAWACAVVNAGQATIAHTLDGDPAGIRAIADHLRTALPPPKTPTESLYAAHELVLLLERIGDALQHEGFHARFARKRCGLRPESLYGRLLPGPTLTVTEVITVWQALFEEWFDQHHAYPASLRAKTILQHRFSEPWTVASLARTVGASRTRLLTEFDRAFGIPPKEYLVRVRLREGLRRMRRAEFDVASAVNSVGYKSPVKFAARLRRYTSHTPARIRRMAPADFEALLDQRLRLHMF